MRTTFIETLCELAEIDDRIWLLTGDLGYSVLERFASRFPQRYLNVGVAEQNMIGLAAGLALCGKMPFVYSIANFPVIRCLEQIRNDVCYHNLNVKVVAVGGGMAYGAAGYTHHAIEDLAVMRALPNMTVVAPGDPIEARAATQAIVNQPGPCYLRLGKGGEPIVHQTPLELQHGQAICVRAGNDVIFVSTGAILSEVVKAADELAARGVAAGVISMPMVKPIDTHTLKRVAQATRVLIVVEEHTMIGGLGEAVAGELMQADLPTKPRLIRAGLANSTSTPAGTTAYLRQVHGIDAAQLIALALEAHSTVSPRI
jgi:transketolase